MNLQSKILTGYCVLMAAMQMMTAILLYEHKRISETETGYNLKFVTT